MKKTIIFAAFAALVLASSCSERVDIPELVGENVISLDLVYGDPATRSDDEPKTTPGEGLENSVTSVQYFFYNDVTENPIYNSGPITNPTISEDLKYSVTLVAGENGVPDLTTMFKNGECIVFAVFNMPSAITAAPLEDVKATAISNTFAHEDGVEGASSGSEWVVTTDAEAVDYDKYFVMVGELPLTRYKNATTYAAKGTVEMNRVAAKIAVDLKIKKVVKVGQGAAEVEWNPMLGGQQIRVYPNNVAGNAVIGGASETPTFPTDLGQFTYKEFVYNSEIDSDYVEDDGTNYVIASQQDFYTYPIEWTPGTDVEPFIKVIVPWRKADGSSQKEIYYKIMLPVESIEANKYYKLTVNISILGTEGEPEVTLEPLSALVVSWQGGAPVNGTISAAKYLSVNRGVVTATSSYDTAEGRFDFYTETSGTDFAASDPVTVRIKEIKQKNLKTGNWEYLYQNFTANNPEITKRGYPTTTGVHYYSAEEIESDWVKLVGDNYLEIGHQLNSDLTSPLMDVTPYYYTVVLSLPSDIDSSHKYDKTVTFVQWPEVYVVADRNSDYVSSTSTINQNNRHKGYVYVNKTQGSDGYNSVSGLTSSSATNNNPNMYVLTVSVSNQYIIGDPRTTNSDLLGWNNNWQRSYWTEGSGTNHRLGYYRPGASTGVNNMIAPKIRIASSYGKVGNLEKQDARRRCASYQEDGIPAGRWRLPTFAEVRFIATLSSLGRIPILFSDEETTNGDYYWVSDGNDTTGAALVDNVGSDRNVTFVSNHSYDYRTDTYVRCVYDEWYWGDATDDRPISNKERFTWGDPKTN